jgi:hypothetical protein
MGLLFFYVVSTGLIEDSAVSSAKCWLDWLPMTRQNNSIVQIVMTFTNQIIELQDEALHN